MTIDNKKRILVVDDNEATLRSIVDELSFCGYSLSEARDGKEGLEKALAEKPDLILLDILMPKMNGFEVIRKLRDDSWGQSVPIIFITSVTPDDAVIKEINKTKPTYYIMKEGWTLEDLVSKVNNSLSNSRSD